MWHYTLRWSTVSAVRTFFISDLLEDVFIIGNCSWFSEQELHLYFYCVADVLLNARLCRIHLMFIKPLHT